MSGDQERDAPRKHPKGANMNKVETAYQALCDLGLSLAATSHNWTSEQRSAWERAERALRPMPHAKPNAKPNAKPKEMK